MIKERAVPELIGYYTPAQDEIRDGVSILANSDYEVYGSVTESHDIQKAVIIYSADVADGRTVVRGEKLDREQMADLVRAGRLRISPELTLDNSLTVDDKPVRRVAMHL